MAGPKILTLDLESSPNLADVWGLWNQNVSISQLRSSTKVISFAAKWLHAEGVEFLSDFHDGHRKMIRRAHQLMDEADILITYNGINFDVKHLRREFVEAGLKPYSQTQNVDLLRVVKANFRFPSNKLDYVSQALGLGSKVKHEGHSLWVKCMARDAEAWERMREYNIADVVLTEALYNRLLPWVKGHPNVGLFHDNLEDRCDKCGSADLRKRGFNHTRLSTYQAYDCRGCGGRCQSGRAVARVDMRSAA